MVDFNIDTHQLRVLAWESTCACTLGCPHCRASSVNERDPEELSTKEACQMLEDAAKIGKAIIILSGGEPLLRDDLEIIAARAIELGHRPVISCNDGRLLTDARLSSLSAAGIRHFSFSMHSEKEIEHDHFVRVEGTYAAAILAFERIKSHGLSFQINTTILPTNHNRLSDIKDWVISLGARAWHLFFIVPMGRAASGGSEVELSREDVDAVLNLVAEESDNWSIPVKITCAPQYARIKALKRNANKNMSDKEKLPFTKHIETAPKRHSHGSQSRSCMAGSGFVFVSYKGDVKPCGYFDLVVGNVRQNSLEQIYSKSLKLQDMRTPQKFSGICGKCKFNSICGGCRARAYAVTGNYLASDPNCNYNP